MPKNQRTETHRLHRSARNFADSIALAATLTWLGAMVGLRWWRMESPSLASLTRAIAGSIAVYSIVFVGLHVVLRAASKTVNRKTRTKKQSEKPTMPEDKSKLGAAEQRG